MVRFERATGGRRGVSPVVGVVLLVGLTAVLAAGVGVAAVGFAPAEPAPQVAVSASVDATDGWPDGQRLVLIHEGGAAVPVESLAFVVEIPRVDARARLVGFPTRMLSAEHVRGDDVFDNGYAGVDGAADAATTDGQWAAGERVAFRIAQGEVDLRSGDRVRVQIISEPANAVLAREAVVAT